jgi:2-oxoglutarate dehydrogenase E1 component
MYKFISNHPNPRELYIAQLTDSGDLDQKIAKEMEQSYWDDLQARLDAVKQKPLPYNYQKPELAWKSLKKSFTDKDISISPPTGIDKKILEKISKHLMTIPKGFTPLAKVHRLLKSKEEMIAANKYDWAMGELLAYGSLLLDGRDVRLSGEDVKRGTFSHRHAIFRDAETDEEYNRLENMSEDQGRFMIYNSLLSEFGVLGFEYGYSLASPQSLVIWEAQFGDFYNGAQTIVDQFILTGKSKWQRMSGLIMLLPHGYEGQGPEHSSARIERWLQNASENNICLVNPTTPANFFHVLRRQLTWNFRLPLIVMSPKSLLRHPECVSALEDFENKTQFKEVLPDTLIKTASKVKKLILCSGKIYYDLNQYRAEQKIENTAIIRIEQLYPFPEKQVNEYINMYKSASIKWVQEEPVNMGAADYIQRKIGKLLKEVVARDASASTATGYKKIHDKEQADLVKEAFA